MSTAGVEEPARLAPDPRQVPPLVDRVAGWSWRLLVVGATAVALLAALSRLRIVVIPLAVAFLLATVLTPPARWMVRRGLPPLIAAWLALLAFVAGAVGMGIAIVSPLVSDLDDLDTTLEDAADEIEMWFVDGPLAIDRTRVRDTREQLADGLQDALSSDGRLLDGAVLVGEIFAGTVLAIVIAFFLVKDGPDLQRAALALLPSRHRERASSVGSAAWSALGRYLLGAATLGVAESIIMGTTLSLVGSDAVLPVAALTFAAAFFPFVGAIIAGAIATLVTLASVGPGAALVVAAVAIVVQQFDNELLAPLIYSRALQMHPLSVILAVATGAAVGGVIGALAAVPVAAVSHSSFVADREWRAKQDVGDREATN